MKPKYLFISILWAAASLSLTSCSEDLNSPVLPEAGSIVLPEAVALDENLLFGVWEAETSYGDNNQNYFEEQYRIDFSTVEDAEAIYSHWYTNAETGIRDSVCDMQYSYELDGGTVILTPKQTEVAAGAAVITATHTGNNRLLLTIDNNGRTDSICTLTRTGDPEPSILSVNRTLPKAGEVIKVTGRNLQFVDHVYLPIVDGEMEITDFTPGSREISFILPPANYTQGSIRMASTSAKVNCYSPAYMFCKACVFFYNFKSEGLSKPYVGSEFEYTIKDMGSLKDKVVNLASDDLPEGHSLTQAQGLVHPDSLLSFYGGTPIEWPVATKTDDKKGYLRFSSGDRFEYVLNNCNGLFTERTPCGQLAIQMDIYVMSDDKPEWSTGYMSWRLNKDQSALDGSMTANVAGWEKGAPLSFAEGWRTFTIPLSKFTATQTGAYSTLGGLIAQLKGSNLQTILTIVNYPLDGLHPATSLSKFQFNIANIRLVPYNTPANTPIE